MAGKRESKIYAYRDLSGEQFGTYLVISPSGLKIPETLNSSSFNIECQECTATRTCKGSLLENGTFTICKCQKKEEKLGKNEVPVGNGLNYMMQNDKKAFHEYIKRKEEENKTGRSNKFSPPHINEKARETKQD